MTKQKIVPHLWFDKEAVEAAEFYSDIFPDSKITNKSIIKDTPSGDCDVVEFTVFGYRFMAISAGPLFKINQSISFMINFNPSQDKDARKHIDEVWEKLSSGGETLMPLDEYPFSDRYGWVKDKYGISWQLILTKSEGNKRPKIVPSLLFVNKKSGKTKEARDFYLSVFKNSQEGIAVYYEKDTQFNQKKGDVMFSDFRIEDMWVVAMDGGDSHKFDFNEAISFIINCKNQEEINYYWKKLSAVPESEQCGWVKDKYGVSWQIVPENMEELMSRSPKKVTPLMLKMKKIIIEDLKKAGENK
jgi:predicted 3-demethylubiquinone-9 3-methyltransferase (glyoxalase superfamily)